MFAILILCAITAFSMSIGNVIGSPVSVKNEGLTLRIVHTNDMHARFEETSKLSAVCSEKDKKAGQCYGGFARIATLVRQARNSKEPVLFLNAGDTFQGSVWYNVYKWEIVTKFLNLLAPDAVSLGNHEFDDGVADAVKYLNNAKFPVVTANLDLSKEPTLRATPLKNSIVLTVNGTKIGVIGYLTPETKILATTENVIFLDEVESIREEAEKLKEAGVNILIALGHSGFDVDKKIAKEVEDIDLVIGGHTNTFLYNGKQPDIEIPEGLYPTEVIQESGRKTYVVQAYAYTKYLGNFSVTFDREGEVTHIEGNPILVDSKIEQAKDILDVLETYRPGVENITLTDVGKTRVLLDGDSKNCRRKECNLGNLIADALIDYNARQLVVKNGWTDAAIAVQNSGSIRASISKSNSGKITMGDVLTVLPFGNPIVKTVMSGEQILAMLEWSVQNLNLNTTANLYGAFLQYSGLQVVYDLTRPVNSKVVSIYVQCAACRVPSYDKLDKSATYKVLMSDFLRSGGDGYSMLTDLESTPLGVSTADVLVHYLENHSPVHPAVEWRISFVENNDENEDDDKSTENTDKREQGEPDTANAYRPIGIMILLSTITLTLTL